MTEFQDALSRFLSGQLDFPGLEAALLRTLQTDPASAASSLQALDHLFRTSRLPAQIYISLKQKIPTGQVQPAAAPQQPPPPVHQPAAPQQPPPALLPPATPTAPDAIGGAGADPPAGVPTPIAEEPRSGILDILQSTGPGSQPPQPPQPPHP
ncbi:MAG: hypothetical protein ACC642_07925, partial [Pseudomonadales bacterium]